MKVGFSPRVEAADSTAEEADDAIELAESATSALTPKARMAAAIAALKRMANRCLVQACPGRVHE